MADIEELCGRCGVGLTEGFSRTLVPRPDRLGADAEALEVCIRCFCAVEIRRLAARPFPKEASEKEAVQALERCFQVLFELRNAVVTDSNDEEEEERNQSGSAAKRVRTEKTGSESSRG